MEITGAHTIPFFHCSAYGFCEMEMFGDALPSACRNFIHMEGKGVSAEGMKSSGVYFSCLLEPRKWMQMEDCNYLSSQEVEIAQRPSANISV